MKLQNNSDSAVFLTPVLRVAPKGVLALSDADVAALQEKIELYIATGILSVVTAQHVEAAAAASSSSQQQEAQQSNEQDDSNAPRRGRRN